MKKIILMRHAKSDWANSELTDHQRPLNNRGKRDGPRMGTQILEKGIIPEVLLVSDAQRTKDTWELINEYFPSAKTIFLPELYLASADTIAQIISEVDDLIDTILILAHNPGITEAFSLLANLKIDNVPTSGVGCITYETDKFSEILNSRSRLDYFIYPKML